MKLPFTTEQLRSIWSMTWPQVIMLLCQFVIGVTDVWAGGQISPETQAAIGLIAQCQMMLMALAMAAVGGAVATVSQSLGAGKHSRAQRYVALVIGGGVGAGMLIAAGVSFWREPILLLIQTPSGMLTLADLFFVAYLWSLPGQYTMTLASAIFRSAKSVMIPLYMALLACVINCFGDLAFGLGWWGFPAYGAQGIAWATFAATTIAGLGLISFLFRDKLLVVTALPLWRWTRKALPYLLKVAGPALGSSLLWQTGYVVLFAITASLPSDRVTALAGLSNGFRIESILFLPAVAFNMTASVLVGHALGKGTPQEAKNLVLTILGVACACMTCVGALLWPWRMELAGLLTPDPNVQQETMNYLTYNILAVPFTVASIVLTGALNGAGASLYPMITFSVGIWLVRLPIAWVLGHLLWKEASGVFAALLISQMFISTCLLWIVLRCDWARFAMKVTHHPAKESSC